MVLYNYSSFLIKRNKQTHSTKSNNLKAHDFFHYNRPIGVELQTTTNRNATLSSIGHMVCKNKCCPDLHMAAVHRAAAILCSQMPVMVKRKQLATPRTLEHLPPISKAIKMSTTRKIINLKKKKKKSPRVPKWLSQLSICLWLRS
ncbi:unnamed protein product [Nyctereutes procyonoides]|uniref:(raccoon dog) hypothetical protein n=1 Tax=Nyctereutes procyonoides TaxID=34880 RepID=A0A811XU13_NYCPR|nr:unnamed protein product [Nyctereutes procyonoides]